MGKLRSS